MSISPVELKKRLRTQAIDRFYSNNEHICYRSSFSLALFLSLSFVVFFFVFTLFRYAAGHDICEREKRKKNAFIDRDSRIVELDDRSTRKFRCWLEEKGNERMITADARFLVTAGAIMKMNCYSHRCYCCCCCGINWQIQVWTGVLLWDESDENSHKSLSRAFEESFSLSYWRMSFLDNETVHIHRLIHGSIPLFALIKINNLIKRNAMHMKRIWIETGFNKKQLEWEWGIHH